MKISDFIAKTVAAINDGVEQINEDKKRVDLYVNESDGAGQVGISFEIPVDVRGDDGISVFPFETDVDYGDAPVPRVAFTVRRRNA